MTVQEIISKLEEKKAQLLKDHSNQVGDENWRRGEFHAIEYTLNLLNSITANTVSIFVSRDLDNSEDFEIHETKPEIKEDGLYYSTSPHGYITTIQGVSEVFPLQPGECSLFQVTKITPQ